MKYLKIYENFQSDEDIAKICQKYRIENFTINNGLVDVDGSIDFAGIVPFTIGTISTWLKKIDGYFIPLKFGHVSGDFNCSYNQLTSLEGAPKSVGGGFYCSYNQLTSLEGAPKSVGGSFYCRNNQLITLEGIPKSVGGDRDFTRSGFFYCYENPVYEVWKLISPGSKWNNIHMELFSDYDCLRGTNIIIDRFNEFLVQIGMEPVDSVRGYNNI
jgi:hypothetical protein